MSYWNPLDKHADIVLSNGNKTASNSSLGSPRSVRSVVGHTTGDWYAEFAFAGSDLGKTIGVANASALLHNEAGNAGSLAYLLYGGGELGNDGVFTPTDLTSSNAAIVGIAYRRDAKKLFIHRDGTYRNGNPVADTGGVVGTADNLDYLIASANVGNNISITLRTRLSEFTYEPPAGFEAWNGPVVVVTGSLDAVEQADDSHISGGPYIAGSLDAIEDFDLCDARGSIAVRPIRNSPIVTLARSCFGQNPAVRRRMQDGS